MAARLKAVKRRKKEKLGLPLDSSSGKCTYALGNYLVLINHLYVIR